MDYLVPGSPEWWRERLLKRLKMRTTDAKAGRAYYDGRHAEVFDRRKVDQRLAEVFDRLRVNLCELSVDILAERLNVEGFRFEGSAGDELAWDVWQRNGLDEGSAQLHTEALRSGVGPVMVWVDGDGRALITCEDPDQVLVELDPLDRRRRRAAVKSFADDVSGEHVCEVYLPDAIWRWRRASKTATWGAPESMPNPLGVVPVVELRNRSRGIEHGQPEVTGPLRTLQDMVNRALANMLVAGDVGVFAQKWASGIEIPTDPVSNKPVEPFRAAIDRLWVSENPAAKFGAFPSTPLDPYATEIDLVTKLFAAQSRIPAHYLLNMEGQWPTGDSLRAAETGLVSKVHARQRAWGESWEEVMRLAFAVEGDSERAAAVRAETLWRDPETRTQSERADALVKLQSLGVPQRQLQLDAGYTESQVALFEEADDDTSSAIEVASAVQKIYLGVPTVLSRIEARAVIRRLGVELGADDDDDTLPATG